MPILRKIVLHGASRGVTLPASWLDYIERTSGKKLREVTMEVNGEITIKPYLSAEDKKALGINNPEASC